MICIIFTELLSLGIMYFCFENENIKNRQKVIPKANMKSVNFQDCSETQKSQRVNIYHCEKYTKSGIP